MPGLYIVFYHKPLSGSPKLLLSFSTASYLEGIVPYPEIGLPGRDDIIPHPHLVHEERLAYISHVGTLLPQDINQVCIVQIDFLHLSQATDTSRLVP